jgi:phosphoglycolate phosphatase
MINSVIFDLDGTLLDTSRGIIESVEHTIDVMHLAELTEGELKSFIGPPLKNSFMNTCGCSEEQASDAVHVFRAYYQEGAVLHAEHYQGMLALCDDLKRKGIKMGVATNKPNRFAVALIHNFDLDIYCTSVFGADEKGKLSKCDLINLCMEDMNAAKSETVLIGDTVNDAIGAEQAGVSFIAVTYGFGFRKGEKISDYPCIGAADSPLQIADVINAINH